jgi:hypothetical protein
MKNVVWKSAVWLCLLACPFGLWAAATPLATVTIADGEAVLIRDTSRALLAEGVRLAKDDIVEVTTKGRLLRIEFTDGVILDLGPESRTLLGPKLGGDRARLPARLHLLNGVAKLTVPKPLAPAAATFSSPAFDVTGVARSAVFIVQGSDAFAFAEAGEVTLQERRGGKAAGISALKGGEFFTRTGDAKTTITPRPTPAFIQRLPRAFLDTLPARAALFKARETEPRPLGEIAYADAEAWVDAEGLRPYFVTRWKALAQNPAFRDGLAANMRAHPEWDRTLFPEKYLPKTSAPTPAQANAPASQAAPRYGTKP